MPVDLGAQPRQGAEQRQVALAVLAQIARGPDIVDPQQHLALLDDLALAHQDRRDDAALQVLHHLDVARGNYPALAAGHLVQGRPARPGEEQHEERGDRHQQQMREAARPQQLGAVAGRAA